MMAAGAFFLGVPGPAWSGDVMGTSMPTVTLTQKDDGTTVSVGQDDVLTIALPENAGSGYRWDLAADVAQILHSLPEEHRYAEKTMGSGGTAIFSFTALKAGKTHIAFKYWRPWEGEKSIAKKFHVKVTVAR
jgi:inhibitor of cysteine peptidase